MSQPKAVQITWMGKPLRQVYPHASRWQVIKYKFFRAVRWTVRMFSIGSVAFAALAFAYLYGSHEVSAQINYVAVPPMPTVDQEAAVMARIADCESGTRLPNGKAVAGSARQFNKDGSVVMHTNDNGTTDVGMWEINMTAGQMQQIAKLKLDVLTLEGNTAYAKWIYENKGTQAWMSSYSCWNK